MTHRSTSIDRPSPPAFATGPSPTRSLQGSFRELVVDLKMDLAESLAKVDDLTFANQRLVRDLDEARAEIRRLRRSQYHRGPTSSRSTDSSCATCSSKTEPPTPNTPYRRISDGGAPIQATYDGMSSSLRNIFSTLKEEELPSTDHSKKDMNASSTSILSMISSPKTTDGTPHVPPLPPPPPPPSHKSSEELEKRYKNISALARRQEDPVLPSHREESDKSAGLPLIKQKLRRLSVATMMTQDTDITHASTYQEEEEEVSHCSLNDEPYTEYNTKTNFAGASAASRSVCSSAARREKKSLLRSKKKKELVSELLIAGARIACDSED